MPPHQPVPTAAPAFTPLIFAPIPQPPPELTPAETEKWDRLHLFRNQIDAIRAHLQPAGTYTAQLNTHTLLYFNEHIARRVIGGVRAERYRSERSLFTRYSKDRRAEDNLHLATIGFPPVGTEDRQLRFWNWYLTTNQLPEVDTVGTGLPDALRRRDGDEQTAAAVLLTFRASAAGSSTAA